MRQKGWRISRIDTEMTWHDAALTRMGQWWQRNRRAGHAFAEAAALHGAGDERFRVPETRKVVIWGLALPLLILLSAVAITPWALGIFLAYPAQVLRLTARGLPFDRAFFLVLGRFPEAQGVIDYWRARLAGRKRGLIEYK